MSLNGHLLLWLTGSTPYYCLPICFHAWCCFELLMDTYVFSISLQGTLASASASTVLFYCQPVSPSLNFPKQALLSVSCIHMEYSQHPGTHKTLLFGNSCSSHRSSSYAFMEIFISVHLFDSVCVCVSLFGHMCEKTYMFKSTDIWIEAQNWWQASSSTAPPLTLLSKSFLLTLEITTSC